MMFLLCKFIFSQQLNESLKCKTIFFHNNGTKCAAEETAFVASTTTPTSITYIEGSSKEPFTSIIDSDRTTSAPISYIKSSSNEPFTTTNATYRIKPNTVNPRGALYSNEE